ncbi:hypothetical protein M832_02210 [Chlamydia avium 10DC88]|uniref:Uncharacterized protein n=1 Tax=Chlamydia avium 10DC88 TaxID=1229831 RepID=W8JFX2_9CHLA|nr:hypothetical protein M832_02210 [Chlamydia avium 10DC88]
MQEHARQNLFAVRTIDILQLVSKYAPHLQKEEEVPEVVFAQLMVGVSN